MSHSSNTSANNDSILSNDEKRCHQNTTTTSSRMIPSSSSSSSKMWLSTAFSIAYYLTTTIHVVVGALGTCFPFGILGIFIPTYSNELGQDEIELMTLHLARMCQVGSLCTGLSLVMLRNQSMYVRGCLILMANLGAIVYSLGEIYLDHPRADRLGIDITKTKEYSRPIQFLIGCLDGGSEGTLNLAAICFIIAALALWMDNGSEEKKDTTTKKE